MGKKRIGNFRSNIFGGFNRRDVIGYIEQLHKELSDLQDENELLRSKLHSEEPKDKDNTENNRPEPELEEGELKRAPDDSVFSLESESDGRSAEPAESVLPYKADSPQNEEIASDNTTEHERKTASLNQVSPVPNKTEQKTGKHIDVSVSNCNESSGQSVSVTKQTIKVRKKAKR